MPSNPSAILNVRALTYSKAPAQASFDVSNMVTPSPLSNVTPFDVMPDTSDPLAAFLSQSNAGINENEAERIGADRYGFSWPMLRVQRLHAGDSHISTPIMRRLYANSRIGQIFTPLEMPQNPKSLYKGHDCGCGCGGNCNNGGSS